VLQLGSRPEHTFECMSQENHCAHQTHHCRDCFKHRKIPLHPGPTKRWGPCTVKKIPCRDSKLASTEDLLQQFRAAELDEDAHVSRKDTYCRRKPLINHVAGLPISAVFRLRYLWVLVRRWAERGRWIWPWLRCFRELWLRMPNPKPRLVFARVPLIPTYASEPGAMGCECQDRDARVEW